MKAWLYIFGKSVAIGLVSFILVFAVSCAALTVYYVRLYPHDGQTGLAAFVAGLNIGAFTGLVVFFGALLFYAWKRDGTCVRKT